MEIRPPGPVPWICAISTPISRARRRVDGAAGTGSSVDVSVGVGAGGASVDNRGDRLWHRGGGRFHCRYRRWGCFLSDRGCGCGRLDCEDGLPDGDGVALLDENFGNGAVYGRRHLNDGLVGFKLDDGLVFGEAIADIDEDADYIAAFDVFSQVGQCKLYGHSVV